MVSTTTLLHVLSSKASKSSYLNDLSIELDYLVDHFNQNGYQVHKKEGFIGPQILQKKDFHLYQYFRDVHFIFWGLSTNIWISDKIDDYYYNALKATVEEQFNKI